MLISRNYNKNVVVAGIEKALKIPRTEALKKVVKTKTTRVIFTTTFNPKLPSISHIIAKHWKTMTKDRKLANTFSEPPMVAFRQPENLKKMLCKAKLPSKVRFKPKRDKFGIKKCNKPCVICDYIKPSKEFMSSHTREKFKINGEFTCHTQGVVYLTTCAKCGKQYVGQTGRSLNTRIKEHLCNIRKGEQVSGIHYNSPGHLHGHMQVQIIEKVTPNNELYRLEREEHWIKTLVTKIPFGLNKND